ncbi:MAG TPA: hypothetical protein VGA56_24240 [Opitutaceae bacterium]
MAKSSSTLDWCVVRLGEDMNWWVEEVSDTVHWDTDGLSIVDPRQVDHLLEQIEPLRVYGFDPDLMERAFIAFRIDKDLGNHRVRLARVKDSVLESDEKLFALPDIVDDENSAYADFLDHITRLRVKMLNDLFDFEQRLTVDEVEEEIREEANADFINGEAVHLYREITSVLEYMPAGWEADEDEDAPRGKKIEEEDEDEFPDIEEDAETLKNDDTLHWDDEEAEEEASEVEMKKEDEDEEDDEEEEDEEADDEDEDDEDEDDDDEEESEENEDDSPSSQRRRR